MYKYNIKNSFQKIWKNENRTTKQGRICQIHVYEIVLFFKRNIRRLVDDGDDEYAFVKILYLLCVQVFLYTS